MHGFGVAVHANGSIIEGAAFWFLHSVLLRNRPSLGIFAGTRRVAHNTGSNMGVSCYLRRDRRRRVARGRKSPGVSVYSVDTRKLTKRLGA